jgi:hypothetical protein
LYYVEAIDAVQKIKSILETSMAMGAFRQNASLLLKPNNAFLDYLGNATTATFDEWYDTRNTKPIYSIRQMPLKIQND